MAQGAMDVPTVPTTPSNGGTNSEVAAARLQDSMPSSRLNLSPATLAPKQSAGAMATMVSSDKHPSTNTIKNFKEDFPTLESVPMFASTEVRQQAYFDPVEEKISEMKVEEIVNKIKSGTWTQPYQWCPLCAHNKVLCLGKICLGSKPKKDVKVR